MPVEAPFAVRSAYPGRVSRAHKASSGALPEAKMRLNRPPCSTIVRVACPGCADQRGGWFNDAAAPPVGIFSFASSATPRRYFALRARLARLRAGRSAGLAVAVAISARRAAAARFPSARMEASASICAARGRTSPASHL